MGRPRKDKRLEQFKPTLIGKIIEEKEPANLIHLLVAYNHLVSIIEHEKHKA